MSLKWVIIQPIMNLFMRFSKRGFILINILILKQNFVFPLLKWDIFLGLLASSKKSYRRLLYYLCNLPRGLP